MTEESPGQPEEPQEKPKEEAVRKVALEPAEPDLSDIGARLERRVEQQTQQPALGVVVSGLVAGLDVGFAPLGLAFVATHLAPVMGTETALLIGAMAYPIGFIFVILGRSQLFTESTLVPAVAVLSRASSIWWLLRQWGLVLGANLVGALVFALIVVNCGPLANRYGPVIILGAKQLLSYNFLAAFLSALLAGWVMALLSWLLAVADSSIGRIAFVWIATFLIGAPPLHHSVSGAAEMLMAVMLGGVSVGDWFFGFQVPVTIGNAVGGVVLVGVLKWLQVKTGRIVTPFGS